jgi:hypothetical protein
MNKRRILGVVLVLFIIGLVIGYKLWTTPPENQTAGEPDFEKNLQEWVTTLDADTAAATTFSGEVADVLGDSSLTLQIKTGVEGFNLNANFHQDYKSTVSGVVAGDVVTLQCICDGLMVPMSADDLFAEKKIDMSRCTILNLEQHKADVSKSLDHAESESGEQSDSK